MNFLAPAGQLCIRTLLIKLEYYYPDFNYFLFSLQQQQQQAQHHQLIAATTQDLTGGSTSHLASAASEFYQHYAANIANFNQMYKQN